MQFKNYFYNNIDQKNMNWRFSQSKILNLITRYEPFRLVGSKRQMNPNLLLLQPQKKILNEQQAYDHIYFSLSDALEPYNHKKIKYVLRQIQVRNAKIQQKKKMPEDLKYKQILRGYLIKFKLDLNIPILNQFLDELQSMKLQGKKKSCDQLQYIVKFLQMRLFRKQPGIQKFIKQETYRILVQVQKRLHNYYLQSQNVNKIKQSILRFIRLYKILLKQISIDQQSARLIEQSQNSIIKLKMNYQNELFYWIVDLGLVYYKVKNYKQAQKQFLLVYQECSKNTKQKRKIINNQKIETVSSNEMNRQKYATVALRILCKIYEINRNIDEVKKLQQRVKKYNEGKIQKSIQETKIIQQTIQTISLQTSQSIIKSSINEQNNNNQKKQNFSVNPQKNTQNKAHTKDQ